MKYNQSFPETLSFDVLFHLPFLRCSPERVCGSPTKSSILKLVASHGAGSAIRLSIFID